MNVHAQLAGPGRRHAHEVGLHRAGDQDCVCVLGSGLAQIELELPGLVAAKGQSGAVVALYIQLAAQIRGEVGHWLQRRRQVAEPDTGELGKDAEFSAMGWYPVSMVSWEGQPIPRQITEASKVTAVAASIMVISRRKAISLIQFTANRPRKTPIRVAGTREAVNHQVSFPTPARPA